MSWCLVRFAAVTVVAVASDPSLFVVESGITNATYLVRELFPAPTGCLLACLLVVEPMIVLIIAIAIVISIGKDASKLGLEANQQLEWQLVFGGKRRRGRFVRSEMRFDEGRHGKVACRRSFEPLCFLIDH